MNIFDNLRSFELNSKIYYYYVKDIENILNRHGEIEASKATMVVYEDINLPYEAFGIYGESKKIQYAMPDDAKEWYEGYLKKK